MAITHHDVMGKHLSVGSKKNYNSCIGKMKDRLTEEETATYLNAEGWLVRPLHHETAARILHECQLRNIEEGSDDMKSQSTASQYSSAMKYWHKESSRLRDFTRDEPIVISPDLVSYLATYATGRRRITADSRAIGEETEASEGRLPIDFSEYKSFARCALAFGVNPRDARLYHGYLILCWNLIARSSTVADLLWNNIGCLNDCITVLYEKGKTNQDGLNKVPWHIYANPDDPLICAVLALGLKLCTETDAFGDIPFKVFPASSSDTSFSSWMKFTAEALYKDPEVLLGVPADRIGTHSLRKGAATYINGLNDGPNPDAIKLRMEHKLGGCDYRYIFRGAGNDMVVGRSVTGMDTTTVEMGVLPPHFKCRVNVSGVISQAFISRSGNSLKRAFPLLIASVIHHWEWLQSNLPETHPFFFSKLYTSGKYAIWKPLVIAGKFDCPETKMRASGLPKIVVSLLETRKVHVAVEAVPQKTADIVLSAISSVGNINLHNEIVLDRTLGPRLDRIEMNISSLTNANLAQRTTPTSSNQFNKFYWKDSWHNYPETFQFPADTCLTLWNLWLFGDANLVNTPYRCLNGTHMADRFQTRLTKTRKVLDNIRTKIDISYEDLTAMGPVEAEKKFLEAFMALYGHIRNFSNMQISNTYKHDLKSRKVVKKQTNPRRSQ